MIAQIIVLYKSEPSEQHLNPADDVISIIVDNTPERDLGLPTVHNVVYIPLKENKGIATAQNEGIRKAMELGCGHVIFFDQDSVYNRDLPLRLRDEYIRIEKDIPELFILAAYPVQEGYTNVPDSKESYVERDKVISSGSFVSVEKIGEVGILEDELFIDYVDFEWCWRAHKKGYRNFYSTNSVLHHMVGQSIKRIFGLNFIISSPFRFYYQWRNYVILLPRKYVPLKWKLLTARTMILQVFCFPFCVKGWRDILNQSFKGLFAGIRKMWQTQCKNIKQNKVFRNFETPCLISGDT